MKPGKLIPKLLAFFSAFLFLHSAQAQTTWYNDADNDGWGNPSISQTATTKPAGYVQNNLDCNDSSFHATEWKNAGGASLSTGQVHYTSMATDQNGTPYIAYSDDATQKATVMKYNGSNWSPVGSTGFSASGASFTSLAIDGSGTPYVVFADFSLANKATVMKYNGSSWVTVGAAGFSGAQIFSCKIAIDGSGTPYVIYIDLASKAVVMKFNGSSWVNVGAGTISPGSVLFTNLSISKNGTVFAAFADMTTGKTTVMKFDGVNWGTVGSALFSPGGVSIASAMKLILDNSGTPYVAYIDATQLNKVTAMKFDGSNWVVLGAQAFTPMSVSAIVMGVDGSDSLFIGYSDGNHSGNITIAKYRNATWQTIANTSISTYASSGIDMAIDKYGIPYIGYADASNSDKASVVKMALKPLGNPSQPSAVASANPIVSGSSTTLSIQPGALLNDASEWKWYTGNCGGTPVGAGTSITVSPTALTTYYVRGEGGCLSSPGSCGTVPVIVIPLGVADVSAPDASLNISPNPGNGLFVLNGKFNSTAHEAKMEIVNLAGQSVHTATIPVANGRINKTLQMENAPADIYILKLTVNSNTHAIRFVKE